MLSWGEFDVSIESERLSYALIEKYDLDSIKGTAIIINLGFNHFWRKNIDSNSRQEFLLAYRLAMSYGYINFAPVRLCWMGSYCTFLRQSVIWHTPSGANCCK